MAISFISENKKEGSDTLAFTQDEFFAMAKKMVRDEL
jgi:hypothetical protein